MNKTLSSLASILLLSIITISCSPADDTVLVQETENGRTEITRETIRMNNCGSHRDSQQVSQRSKSIQVGGAAAIGVNAQVIESEVSANYSQVTGISRSQSLTAAGGTYMEFVLEWEEKTWLGNVTSEGKRGAASYRVSLPISVELISSRDIGCPSISTTANPDIEEVANATTAIVTISPAPTATPLPTKVPSPSIDSLTICNQPCNGSNGANSLPEGTTTLYAMWNYKNIPNGASYERTWTLDGHEWVSYQCHWSGSSNGTDSVRMAEPGGFHSGTWEVTITVNGTVLAREQIDVEGNWTFWEPAGTFNRCYFN